MKARPQVGLLVTCLVDFFRPEVGFGSLALLAQAGCKVVVPNRWTCCGQPAFNSGDVRDAQKVARAVIEDSRTLSHVVVPSASCAGMIRRHYPELFAGTPLAGPAAELAAKTHELFAFLVEVCGLTDTSARFSGTVTYHDSCSALREMGVRDQPRRLMASVGGLELRELPEAETCCGFGGTFCVKYPAISDHMVRAKLRHIEATGAETLVGSDLGCLLNLAGKLHRTGSRVKVRHLVEILASLTDAPPMTGDSQ